MWCGSWSCDLELVTLHSCGQLPCVSSKVVYMLGHCISRAVVVIIIVIALFDTFPKPLIGRRADAALAMKLWSSTPSPKCVGITRQGRYPFASTNLEKARAASPTIRNKYCEVMERTIDDVAAEKRSSLW